MWQIIGAGAIGCLWAANLLRIGQPVHLISRRVINLNQLTYQNLQGNIFTFECSNSTQLVNNNSPILVCVKAQQVKQALLQHRHNIKPEQVIILMHNGMGSAEQVAEILPNNPIICATTANASLKTGPLSIKQTGLGITYLGAFNEQAKGCSHVQKMLNNALNDCHWCEDIQQKLWLKLLINVAINPLSAIYGISNGKLAEQQYQTLIKQMLTEVMPLTNKLQLAFDKNELFSTINNVIHATSENYSSMNRDIHFKRPSENEYISGYLIQKALQHNIETPLIKSLYQQIIALEHHSLIASNIE